MHKVVVGITTLNNPDILNNCLKSIYKTHDMYKGLNIKILVIDDCSSDENLERVLDAIAARKMISFQYRNSDFSLQERVIEPYGVGTKNGYWYVAGRDLDRKSIRLFRLDRCVAMIKEQGKAGSYEVPGDFLMVNHLSARDRNRSCTLSVRVNRGNEIRKFSALIESSEDWDTLLYSYTEDSELMSDLLWHGDDVKVIAPVEIVAQYNSILAEIAKLHG